MLRLLSILVVFLILLHYVEASEGKRLYIQKCVSCHNTNPSKQGSIGPDLLSTPREVFHTKVILRTYPEGYKPKRRTRVMPRFNLLTTDIDLIYNHIQRTKP